MAKARKKSVKNPASSPKKQIVRVENAVKNLLEALEQDLSGELESTPKRVANLWLEHLLVGDQLTSEQILTQSTMESDTTTPVCVTNLGTYLICPHHLTIAFGQTHIAYEPNGKLVGFGALADLVKANTARLTFQEDATEKIANAIFTHLNAKSIIVMMSATHPCHTINHPRAHLSEIVTWASRGTKARTSSLKQLLKLTLND